MMDITNHILISEFTVFTIVYIFHRVVICFALVLVLEFYFFSHCYNLQRTWHMIDATNYLLDEWMTDVRI